MIKKIEVLKKIMKSNFYIQFIVYLFFVIILSKIFGDLFFIQQMVYCEEVENVITQNSAVKASQVSSTSVTPASKAYCEGDMTKLDWFICTFGAVIAVGCGVLVFYFLFFPPLPPLEPMEVIPM